MKRVQRLLETAARRLDLPGEIAAGLPKLEMTGFSQLSVEHHKGVLAYSPENITLSVGIGRVQILGKRLAITLMNHTYVVVTGSLEHVELIPEERHE